MPEKTNLPKPLLDKPIAFGRTAEIYAWEDGWVLKLFHDWFSEEAVRTEAKLARAVQAAGLHVPAVGDVLEIGNRLGLPYRRVDGSSVLEQVRARPWTLPRFSRLLAELQAGMHDNDTVTGLPPQRQRLESKIRGAQGLSSQLKAAALEVLAAMPQGARHPHRKSLTNPIGNNILKLESGEQPPGEFLRAAEQQLRLQEWIREQEEQEGEDPGEDDASEPDPDGVPAEARRIWASSLGELQLQMTRATFDTWLRGSQVIEANDECLTVAVQHAHAVDWLQNRLLPVIECTVARHADGEMKITFIAGA